MRSVGALAYGLAAILLLTPLLGRAALALLSLLGKRQQSDRMGV